MSLARLVSIALLLAVGGLPGSPVRGQLPADGPTFAAESARTLKRLAEAERQLLAGETADTVDALQRLLDEAGNDLVTADGTTFQPARTVAHGLLARLPADVLEAYRASVDPPARALVADGINGRDTRPLQAALARYYCSRPAEQALLALGDLRFEQGRFHEAEAAWEQLLPGEGLRYPAPATDPAAVKARIVLSKIFRNARDSAAAVTAFRAAFPEATGHLAGKDGRFAEILAGVSASPPPPVRYSDGESWSSFAGGPDRAGRANEPLPRYWLRAPTWKTPLPSDPDREGFGLRRSAPTRPERAAAFHPVVLDGVVYVADGVRVSGFDLRTGKPRGRYDLRADDRAFAGTSVDLPDTSGANHTLTAADGSVFARLGRPAEGNGGPSSALVRLDPQADGTLTPRWKRPPPADGAAWEGAPIVADGRVYAAFARPAGNRVAYSIACYNDPPADPVWVAPVGEAPGDPTGTAGARHHLLTRAGDRLVFAPDVGLVAAVEMATGRPAWGFRYGRNDRLLTAGSPRDVCPPVHADGRVFVAPADSNKLFALDAGTGRPLWTAGPFQVCQLLGVSRGRLVVTLVGRPSGPFTGVGGVRALDVETGSADAPAGWAVHDDPLLRPFGRGLVSDELIVWPTNSRDGIFLLNAADGTRRFPWLPNAHGNLAHADGVLVVATPTEVWGYVSPRRDATAEPPADRAERAVMDRRPADAKAILRNVVASGASADNRTRAAARLVSLGEPNLPPAADPDGWLLDPSGKPVTLGRFAGLDRPAAMVASFPVRSVIDEDDPSRRPRLGFDAKVADVIAFPSPGCVPLWPIGDAGDSPWYFASDGRTLFAYQGDSARPVWSAAVPDGRPLTHVLAVGDAVVVAGPRSVARVRIADGSELWRVLIPETDPLPDRPQPGPHAVGFVPWPGMSDFTLAGSALVARIGGHHLVAVDLALGHVRWVLDSRKDPRFAPFPAPDTPEFRPDLAADAAVVIARVGDRRWTIDANTGTVTGDVPTTPAPWPSAPAAAGVRQWIVTDEPGRIRSVGADPGRGSWAVEFGGPASLTGRPPGVRAIRGTAFAAVFRNYGVELARVNPVTGSQVWGDRPALLRVGNVDLIGADADESRVYVPADGRLFARDLATGRPAWTTDLAAAADVPPDTPWHVRAGRRAIVAVPTIPVSPDPPQAVAARIARRFTSAGQLPAGLMSVYDAWVARTLPVLLLDPDTGAVRGRLDLPTGPVAATRFGPPSTMVLTTGRAYRLN